MGAWAGVNSRNGKRRDRFQTASTEVTLQLLGNGGKKQGGIQDDSEASGPGDCKDRDAITEIENSGGRASLDIEVHYLSFSSAF